VSQHERKLNIREKEKEKDRERERERDCVTVFVNIVTSNTQSSRHYATIVRKRKKQKFLEFCR
jgi:hypothetical protein